MKYLIFSDVHSNLEAFEELLEHKKVLKNIDKFIFLGDLVGYGPNPNEVINIFKKIPNLHAVRGNHDKVISGIESSALFNPIASNSAEWNKKLITAKNVEYLKAFDPGPKILDRFLTICHGSTFDEDYYIFSKFEALESFKFMSTPITFFGHTHFPVMYLFRNERIDLVQLRQNANIKLDNNTKYLINPGSIGQPRDRNPDSSFIIFDAAKMNIEFIRYSYDFKKTKNKIFKAGLSKILGTRLETGV